MSDAMSYNFGAIEGAASASFDRTAAELNAGDAEGQTVQKLAGIWGGVSSEAYQQTQQRWDSTAATADSFVAEDGSSEAAALRFRVVELTTAPPPAFQSDDFDFKAMEESEAAGTQLTKVKTFICPAEVAPLNGDDTFAFQASELAPSEASPYLGFKFDTVYTTKIDWSGSSESAAGDYNNDGVVVAADYVVWRKTDALDTGDMSFSSVEPVTPVVVIEWMLVDA